MDWGVLVRRRKGSLLIERSGRRNTVHGITGPVEGRFDAPGKKGNGTYNGDGNKADHMAVFNGSGATLLDLRSTSGDMVLEGNEQRVHRRLRFGMGGNGQQTGGVETTKLM